jgi:hypothetical protein
MRLLWNNKVRRARSSLLWSIVTAPVDPTVYPFLIIDAFNGAAVFTSITAAGWNLDIVNAPAEKIINLLSTPSGGILNAFSLFQMTNGVNGDLALPPLPHTITTAGQIPTISTGDGLYSITATTLKWANFSYGTDMNSLETLDLPALKGGELVLQNIPLADYGRTNFPAYIGNDAIFGNFNIDVTCDNLTLDFPAMLKISSIYVASNNVDPVYDCTMPLLNEVAEYVGIYADVTSNISLPSLTNLGSSGAALASTIYGDAIIMPLALMPDNTGASLTLGKSTTTGVSLFYLALTSMRNSSLFIYMQAFPSPFQIFATVQTAGTVGNIYIRFDAGFPSPLTNADTIWSHLDAKLPSGGTTTIDAPTPTLGASNVAYGNLVGKGYTCAFT